MGCKTNCRKDRAIRDLSAQQDITPGLLLRLFKLINACFLMPVFED